MRLGSSILGGKPMRIPGIVDVYQVGDEWVARSWPKVQNQPNSAAQLLWRKRFVDAKEIIKKWSGNYLDAWKGIEAPSGKMWIDIAMHSLLTLPVNQFPSTIIPPLNYTLYYAPGGFGACGANYMITREFADAEHQPEYYWVEARFGAKFKEALKWNDMGFECPSGKRPKKIWQLSYASKQVGWIDGPPDWYPPGSYYYRLLENCPGGVTITQLVQYFPTDGGTKRLSLFFPPIYCKPVTVYP